MAVALYAANVGIAMILDGITQVVAIRDGLSVVPETDPRAPGRALLGALRRAMVFFVSIPIAYAISPSLAQWFWLLLIVGPRADRRWGVTRRS